MITRTTPAWQTTPWQKLLAEAVRDPEELLRLLDLSMDGLPGARAATREFGLLVPRGFVARMQPGNPHDPLLRQVLPLASELQPTPGYVPDPVGDLSARTGPGLLHKYQGRALLVTTAACGIHCRYCFRRQFPYQDTTPRPAQWQQTLDYLRTRPELEEIILSGGDPLSLSDARLAEMIADLQDIPTLRRLRLHSRYPVILPERITPELLRLLQQTRLEPVLVIHTNHANEIDAQVVAALQALRHGGVQLLNQSVLLRGVNDEVDSLCALSRQLFSAGVLPYYLHVLDRVQGAAHFDLPEDRARELHQAMQHILPGYLVPKLVREIPGQPGKTLLA